MVTYSQLGKNGRLGNQLFQIASTIGIATLNDMLYYFPKWEYSDYFKKHIPQGELSYPYDRMSWSCEYEEEHFHYKEVFLDETCDWNLTGYFQSWKYFEHCKNDILDYFTPKVKPIESNNVSIHIRRGDYLTKSNYHTNLGMDYYFEAMSLFPKDTQFCVYSDDFEYCFFDLDFGEYEDRVIFHVNENDISDLFDMSRCSGHIIANSSYSWWAAYLNLRDVQVVAPKNWFQVPLDTKDLYLPNWIQI